MMEIEEPWKPLSGETVKNTYDQENESQKGQEANGTIFRNWRTCEEGIG